MLACGWRVLSGRARCSRVGPLYADAALGTGPHGADVRELDRMRRARNRVEYGDWGGFGAAEIRADLNRARAIVAAVEVSWPTTT